MSGTFVSQQDRVLGETFLRDGYIIRDAEDTESLSSIRDKILEIACGQLGIERPEGVQDFFDHIHKRLTVDRLNDFRVAAIAAINNVSWMREAYYRVAEKAIHSLVGNELAMQRRLNLSIQFPQDDSSLLPPHADTWSGDSPYELVLWIPLVDCHSTKSMFLLPPNANNEIVPHLARYQEQGIEALFRDNEAKFRYISIKYGQFMLFDQALIHGNRVNREPTTRWSLNCRFKGLFTPYADKKLGEFFEPITMRPATQLGLKYGLPGNFRD